MTSITSFLILIFCRSIKNTNRNNAFTDTENKILQYINVLEKTIEYLNIFSYIDGCELSCEEKAQILETWDMSIDLINSDDLHETVNRTTITILGHMYAEKKILTL